MRDIDPRGIIFYMLLEKPEFNFDELRTFINKLDAKDENGWWYNIDITRDSLLYASDCGDFEIKKGIRRAKHNIDIYNIEFFNEHYRIFIPDPIYKKLKKVYPLSKNVKKKMTSFKKYKCIVKTRLNPVQLKKEYGIIMEVLEEVK